MDLPTLAAALVPLGILIYWFVDACKDVTNQNWNGLATRLIAVGSAFLAIVIYAHSSIDLGGVVGESGNAFVSKLSWVDQLLLSLLFAATAGTGNDILRTFNRSDGNIKETLLPALSRRSVTTEFPTTAQQRSKST